MGLTPIRYILTAQQHVRILFAIESPATFRKCLKHVVHNLVAFRNTRSCYVVIFYPKLGPHFSVRVIEIIPQVQRIFFYSALLRRHFGCVLMAGSCKTQTRFETNFILQITLQLSDVKNIIFCVFLRNLIKF